MIRLTHRNLGSLRTIFRIALLFFAFILVSNNVMSTYLNSYDVEEFEFSEEENEESSENLEELTDMDEFLSEGMGYFFLSEMGLQTKERQLYGWANPDTDIHTPPPEQLLS